jgi:predicted dehydrogenase
LAPEEQKAEFLTTTLGRVVTSSKEHNRSPDKGIDRRKFLKSTATVGAGLVLNPAVFGGSNKDKVDDINVALIGLGVQCGRLMDAIFETGMDKTEGIRFKAVCDIFPYRLKLISRRLKIARKYDVTAYENYEEMLAKEKSLDAAIIATPDWLHAPMTIACLKAGLHVYCEKEMSNSLQDARQMVQTARQVGKLLQIGHQRRSNPRYQVAEKLIREHRLLGKLLNINAQWNRSVSSHKIPLPNEKIWMDEAALKRYGYDSMDELVNWRWYEKFGGGPLGDLGSHQIDIFNWFLGDVKPRSVLASGANDYFNYQQNENVMSIYDYQTEQGSVRAFYQVLNTTCWGTYGQYYETFMGDVGTLLISEFATEKNNGWVCIEDYARSDDAVMQRWNDCIRQKLIGGQFEQPTVCKDKTILVLGGSKVLWPHPLLQTCTEHVHQPHLKNFFDAIRGKASLNCCGEVAYATAVAVLKANDAIKEGKKIEFRPEDFEV